MKSETEFQAKMRARRAERMQNQAEAARECHVSLFSYCRWETGHSKPSAGKYKYIAEYLGYSLDEVFDLIDSDK